MLLENYLIRPLKTMTLWEKISLEIWNREQMCIIIIGVRIAWQLIGFKAKYTESKIQTTYCGHFNKLWLMCHLSSRAKWVIQHTATQSFQNPAAPPSQWKETGCAIRQFSFDVKHTVRSYADFVSSPLPVPSQLICCLPEDLCTSLYCVE